MKRWTTLTGKNVGFRSDVTHATVTYFKKFDIIDHENDHENDHKNNGINDHENDGVNNSVSVSVVSSNDISDDPVNDPVNDKNDPINDHENDGVNDHENDPINDHENNYEKISPTEEAILRMMLKKEIIIYAEIQGKLSISIPTIRRAIKKLRQNGFLVREGSDRVGRWIVTESGKTFLQKKRDKSLV